MGEKITIKGITIIDQPSEKLMLLQIDIWFDEQNKGGRIFIDSKEFFRMIGNR